MLRLVLGVGALLQPFARPLLKRRLAEGKEDPDRWLEKLGETQAARPDGPVVWMHGVGVGEVMALRGLIVAMSAVRPDLSFLVTSSARSSGEVFAKNLPPKTHHQYLPLDLPRPVAAFLDHWRPDLAVWSDQEVWPRLAVEAARRSIPQALVAARVTDASAKAKQRFGQAYGDLYRLLDVRHAQDAGTAAHLSALMGDDTVVHVSGSLKAAAAPLADDAALRATLPTSRRIWLAASAHRADIDVALNAHHSAATNMGQNRLLIIAPRSLSDAAYIQQRCKVLKLTCVTRSENEWPDDATQVFIADTFGELGLWYRAADAALIGGTFDNTQGHNPWEAVAVNCPVLHGPNISNFKNDFKALSDHRAAQPIENPTDITAALADPKLPDMAVRATAVRAASADGLARISTDLLGLMKP